MACITDESAPNPDPGEAKPTKERSYPVSEPAAEHGVSVFTGGNEEIRSVVQAVIRQHLDLDMGDFTNRFEN